MENDLPEYLKMSEKIEYSQSYSGYFLTSSAILNDPNFIQTLVLLIDHNKEGAFGLTVNRASGYNVKDVMPEEFHTDYNNFPVHLGGPVQKQNLFYLYSLLPDAKENKEVLGDLIVCPGVYLGGNYDILKQSNKYFEHLIFFLGYSGWGPLQLEHELSMKSWIKIKARDNLIFSDDPTKVWKKALKYKGGVYQYFADHVENPNLN